MARYLHLDGEDDYLETTANNFTKVVIDFRPYTIKEGSAYFSTGSYKDFFRGDWQDIGYDIQEVAVDGVVYYTGGDWHSGQLVVQDNARQVLELTVRPYYYVTRFLSSVYGGLGGMESDVYSIKLYEEDTLVANFDFTVDTVSEDFDVSGNGTHLYLHGGTWVETEDEDVTLPTPNVVSVSRTRISNKAGLDRSYIRFTFDVDITQWTVNVLGVDHETGIVADSGGGVASGTEIVAEVDWSELYQEGLNKVNIYGKSGAGWTKYEDGTP